MNVYAVLAMLALAAGGGWTARDWNEDSKNLAVELASKAIAENAIKRESTIASDIEQRLSGIKASEKIIDRGIIREIEKPIYMRVCLEPGAISLLNAAARGEAPSDTSKPAGEVPRAAQPVK